jgi:LacI family transcriptional regulator
MATTIYDIAKQVGTSYCTVSRALNNHPRIGAKTKEKILKTAKDMSYRPSYFARGLTAGKTKLIGLVIPDFKNPVYVEFLRYIEVQCVAKGYHVIPMEYRLDNSYQRACLEKMMEFRCDGVIAFFQNAELFRDLLDEFWEMRMPCIQTVGYITGQHMDRVIIKMEQGVEKAVKHLVDLGHRKIVMIDSLLEMFDKKDVSGNVQKDDTKDKCCTPFGNFFQAAMLKHGLECSEDNIIFSSSENQLADGLNIGEMLIQSRPEVTAVITHNDLFAVGILKSLLSKGRRVPDDFSIIGADNTWLAETSHVPLTSIDINLPQLANAAMDMMFSRVNTDNWDKGKEIQINVDLFIRQSTGPCKS